MRHVTASDDRSVKVTGALRPLTVCADDYGLAAGIDDAILDLLERRRLAAVSCMVIGRSWQRSAPFLRRHWDDTEVGLHFTLTQLPPAGAMPRLAANGRLPELGRLIRESLTKRLDHDEIAAELARQVDRFTAVTGRLPDFIDGHQHVHQLPGVRAAVLALFRDGLVADGAWLRYPAMPLKDAFVHRVAMARTCIISTLGLGFRASGSALGIAGNGTFRGVRNGRGEPGFGVLFKRFVRNLGDRPLLMCHPGEEGDPFVADALAARRARQDEHAFLAAPEFLDVLAGNGLRLAGMGRCSGSVAPNTG